MSYFHRTLFALVSTVATDFLFAKGLLISVKIEERQGGRKPLERPARNGKRGGLGHFQTPAILIMPAVRRLVSTL
jgi:hypothetical protein